MLSTNGWLLAISFTQPGMLWGLVAVAVPIVLHFLRRQPVQEMDWAAMRFLMAAMRKRARRRRIEEYLLLAARVSALALLAFALAGPSAEAPRAARPTSQPTHFLITLDDSFSMAYRLGGADDGRAEPEDGAGPSLTVLDRAKQVVRRILRTARPGDTFSLLRFCGPDRVLIEQPTPSPEAVLQTLASLRPSDQPADILPVSESLLSVARLSDPPIRRQVVVISDFQRVGWQPASDGELTSLRENFRRLSQAARVTLIDVGQQQARNAAVVDLTADRVFATSGQTATLTARIRWFPSEADAAGSDHGGGGQDEAGGAFVGRRTLQLYVDGRLRKTTSVRPEPGAALEAQARFQLAMGDEGDHVIEVRAEPDGLPVDDRRWLVLPVRPSVRVLLVDGRPVGTPEETATFFVQKALSPDETPRRPTEAIQATVIRDDQLVEQTLGDYDCVFVCDVPVLTGDDVRTLEEYVRAGGGVIVAIGPSVDPAAYNAAAGPGRLLPGSLGEIVGDPIRPQRVFAFDEAFGPHPVLDAFRGNPEAGLQATPIFAYRRVHLADADDARFVLSYDSGDPALVEKQLGAGHVLLITTSLDRRWGAWPVWAPSFVPLLHELVRYAASGRWQKRERAVGDRLVRLWPAGQAPEEAIWESPDGTKTALPTPTRQPDGTWRLAAPPLFRAGVYRLRLGPPMNRTEPYVANVDPRESDLAKLSQRELQQTVLPGVEFRYARRWQRSDRPQLAQPQASPTQSYSPPLLLAVLLLVLAEPLLTWWLERP